MGYVAPVKTLSVNFEVLEGEYIDGAGSETVTLNLLGRELYTSNPFVHIVAVDGPPKFSLCGWRKIAWSRY
jgi:hypothetical protein